MEEGIGGELEAHEIAMARDALQQYDFVLPENTLGAERARLARELGAH